MAVFGSWGNINFEVSPSLVKSFSNLTLSGSCETETKENGKAQFVAHKKQKPFELSFDVILDARLGVEDVRGAAIRFVKAARNGAKGPLMIGEKPVLETVDGPAEFLCTSAKVSDIMLMADGTWLSCKVALQFKYWFRAAASSSSSGGGGGGGGGGGSSGSKKTSSKSSSKKSGSTGTLLSENAGFQSTKDKAAYDDAVKQLKEQRGAKQTAKKTTSSAKKSSSTAKKSKTPNRAKSVKDMGPTNWAR